MTVETITILMLSGICIKFITRVMQNIQEKQIAIFTKKHND